ncbi:hypothetical protein [Psychroserpens sp. S379A]|uniref:hypothetical protein n=1 Tax=Psychroserpens sp. S379A TaxID=3415137 RepID=UPI003C7C47FC
MYYQLNIDYIIETYCVNKEEPELQCNGKCHLSKQLQVVSTKTSNSSSNTISNVLAESFFPVFFHKTLEKQKDIYVSKWSVVHNYKYANLYAFSLGSKLYKPPIS